MHAHPFGHHEVPTNGAPQVVALCFLFLVVMMLLLPLAEVSFRGALEPAILVKLMKTDAGFNVFALLLFLVPLIGIGAAFLARSMWREVTALIALAGVVLLILTLVTLNHGTQGIASGLESVSLGIGGYVLLGGYALLAIIAGVATFRGEG
jgi:hypothetical protein